jgi:hypothetical protein
MRRAIFAVLAVAAVAVAVTRGLQLVRAHRTLAAARQRLNETRGRWQAALAHASTAADSYAAVEEGPSAAAWAELLIAAGVPAPVMLARGQAPAADCRLLVSFDPARATGDGRVVLVVEPGGAPAVAAAAHLGDATLPLAAQPAHAIAGDRPLLVADDRTVYATVRAGGGAVVVRLGLDLAALLYRLRQGDPSRAGRDSDGNGALQPADLLPPTPAHADETPFADDTVDALFAAIDAAAPCRLPRTRGLPAGVARLVVLTADQDYVADEVVESMAAMLTAAHASATFLLTDPAVGAHPDLNLGPDGNAPRLGADSAALLLRGGFGLGLHPFLGEAAQLDELARRFEALTGVRALTARNHHLGWRGFVDVPAAEAAAGVALNLDAMTVCDGARPCAAFAGGSVRPMRFVDAAGRALPILQQPTAVDDYSLRERDEAKRAAAARALGARAHQLLDLAARAGGPLVVNAHPVFVALAPDWLRPLLDDGGARIWSAEAWLDFVARRRSARITMPRCDAPPIADLPPGVSLR